MKRRRWYVGGLIGSLVAWGWLAIAPINYFNLFYLKLNQNILNVPVDWFLFQYLVLIEHLILGFIIGYFIHKKFFKKRRK